MKNIQRAICGKFIIAFRYISIQGTKFSFIKTWTVTNIPAMKNIKFIVLECTSGVSFSGISRVGFGTNVGYSLVMRQHWDMLHLRLHQGWRVYGWRPRLEEGWDLLLQNSHSHTEPLFASSKILKLRDLYEYQVNLFMYDFCNK